MLLLAFGCTKHLTVNDIIDKSINAYGGQKVLNSNIQFDFRKKHYQAKYHNNRYELTRSFSDSTGNYVDILNNDGFTRTYNATLVSLNEEWKGKYSRSINSVIYFFRVPFNMKDGAVIPELIDQNTFYVDYMAYSYSTSGGGKRFRETINQRDVNGLHVVDYINYEPEDMGVAIEEYDKYFLEDGLKELSRIINENVSIEYLN
jgi:hypothetical protein